MCRGGGTCIWRWCTTFRERPVPVPGPGQCCSICPGEYRDVELGVVCLHGEWGWGGTCIWKWRTMFHESPVPGQCCPIWPGEYRDVELGVVCLHRVCVCVCVGGAGGHLYMEVVHYVP